MFDNPLTDPLFVEFRNAAGLGAHYELAVRMLASKTPALKAICLAKRLEDVEAPVEAHFAAHLGEREKLLFEHVRVIRNKLLHGELPTARNRLGEVGHQPRGSHVYVGEVPLGLTKEKFLEAMGTATRVVDGGLHLQAPAPDAKPRPDTDVLSWFFQLSIDGSTKRAAEVFTEAIQMIDRLARLPNQTS